MARIGWNSPEIPQSKLSFRSIATKRIFRAALTIDGAYQTTQLLDPAGGRANQYTLQVDQIMLGTQGGGNGFRVSFSPILIANQ